MPANFHCLNEIKRKELANGNKSPAVALILIIRKLGS